ncbi:MFS transporter [Paludifilum halophilum]|uniref:MFS transporter n=1 Tax=Paludifilum halophilum TaxID=1642702 RepID=A0A235B419_9BACL|nr:MFS transporter [Paludifilum halophilum]OYD06971.1 MFS transporter [Paludifilum halophilum]
MSNTWKIYILTLTSFLVGTSQFVISGILDQIAVSLDVSVASAGQLITVFALGNAIGTPILIAATAKSNQRKQLLLSLSIILISLLLTVLYNSFGLLILARIIMGMGTGVFVVTAYNLSSKLAKPGKEIGAMANIAMGYNASLVLGVPIGRVIASAYHWHIIFWMIGLLAIVATIVIFKFIPSVKGEEVIPLRKQLSLLKDSRIVIALSITLFTFLGYSVLNSYIAPFLGSVTDEKYISAILFIIGIASLAGSKLGGFTADHYGKDKTLLSSLILQSIALIGLFLVMNSTIFIVIMLAFWSVVFMMFGPTQNYNLISLAPQAASIMLSLNSSFVQIGFALGSGLGGIAVNLADIHSIIWVALLSTCVAAMTGLFSFKQQAKV